MLIEWIRIKLSKYQLVERTKMCKLTFSRNSLFFEKVIPLISSPPALAAAEEPIDYPILLNKTYNYKQKKKENTSRAKR